MLHFIYFCLFLCVSVLSDGEITAAVLSDEYCDETSCVGECKQKYIPDISRTKCILCPEIGDGCEQRCCGEESGNVNRTLQCWEGICQFCHDADGNWICRERWKEILLIFKSEIAMGFYLIFILLCMSIILYKICTVAKLRCQGERFDIRRTSVGSLQRTVDERLRDAPPRYSVTTATRTPDAIYLVEGFVHDSSVPPPPYTWVEKIEDQKNRTLHI